MKALNSTDCFLPPNIKQTVQFENWTSHTEKMNAVTWFITWINSGLNHVTCWEYFETSVVISEAEAKVSLRRFLIALRFHLKTHLYPSINNLRKRYTCVIKDFPPDYNKLQTSGGWFPETKKSSTDLERICWAVRDAIFISVLTKIKQIEQAKPEKHLIMIFFETLARW